MIIEFSGYRVDTERLELWGPSGPIPLQPQAFSLLVYLIENAGRVVSKDEIFDTVWQGRVVGDATLHSRINALRRALGDDGTSQSVIKTLPRQGFRFLREVQTFGIPASESHQGSAEQAAEPLAATGPVVAVLPFKNLSGDPEQGHFADGIAEYILTALGRFGWIDVIARSSRFN